MALTHQIQLISKVDHCDAEIYLNDIPVHRLTFSQGAGAAVPVHQYLRKGENALRIVVNPGPVPAMAQMPGSGPEIDPAAQASARLLVVPLGAFPQDGQASLLEARYSASARQSVKGPHMVTATGTLPVEFGTRLWESARPIAALDQETERSALEFLQQVTQWMQGGMTDELVDVMRKKTQDFCTAYQTSSEQELHAFRAYLDAAARQEGWQMAPISAQASSLRLCAHGRLIQCIAVDWKPLIRMADLSKGGLLLSMGLARGPKGWEVVF